MKTLLVTFIVSLGVIAATVPAKAAPASQSATNFAQKTFGGFSPGKKFKLKIVEATAAIVDLDGGARKTSVPKGIPKFKKGDKITFKIGKKGELTGKGFKIKYQTGSDMAVSYVNEPTASKLDSQIGNVYINFKHQVQAADLVFIKFVRSGFTVKTYTVTYVLE